MQRGKKIIYSSSLIDFPSFFQSQADIYTDVSYYRSWIDDEIRKNGGATFCD